MDEKEMQLAVAFKSAPKEVQDAATAHHANVKSVNKLKIKLAETAAALEQAEIAMGASDRAFRDAMKSWKLEA